MPLFIAVVLIAFAIWALVINPRRKKSSVAFSALHRDMLNTRVLFYRKLNDTQKEQFETDIVYFLEHYRITGVGFTPTEEDRLLVAASGVIPIFGFPHWMYRNLNEVLIYPNAFNHQYETTGTDRNIAGMVGSGAMNRTMILSRQALHDGFENEHSKSNVGIHEFVHLIDKADGAVDGLPESIMAKPYMLPWLKMIHEEISAIRHHDSDIDPYAAYNEGEFLSVVSEYFFNQPELLEHKHPQLYAALTRIFHQDPAGLTDTADNAK
jgi:Mlc titration factor MtfA (ptsG expression regulator)